MIAIAGMNDMVQTAGNKGWIRVFGVNISIDNDIEMSHLWASH